MKRPLTILAAAVAVSAALPSGAFAFGTVNGKLDQRSEHERITRLALQCSAGEQAPACFQPRSLDNVAGKSGTFGAVGAADDAVLHRNPLSGGIFGVANLVTGDEDFWHCDNADYLSAANGGPRSYDQSRGKAMNALRECLGWGRAMLYDGPKTPGTSFIKWGNLPPATPNWGALDKASTLLDKRGAVNTTTPSGTCTFNGSTTFGNAKCNVLEPWGYVLHMSEDLYSHTNWADKADPSLKLSVANPPGLGEGLAPFLDLRRSALPSDDDIPSAFTGGCFKFPEVPFFNCNGRVAHGGSSSGINKDKELIDTATGVVSDPITPRGKITVGGVSNAQRAVNDAVAEAKRQWEVFRAELIQRYGLEKGTLMACVLTMDDTSQCAKRNVVAVVDTSKPATKQALAAQAADTPAMSAARSLIGDLDASDRVSVLSFDSADGQEDADPFVAPADAEITRGADAAADPSTTDEGKPLTDDPTFVAVPDATDTTPTADDRVGEGDHESPADPNAPQPALPAQAPAQGAEPQPATTALPRSSAKSAATANALSSAAALLDNDGAPMGQRGIVLSTNRLGDTDALVKQIDALADAGTSVSLVLFGASLPDDVIAAVERAQGVALALPAGMDRASAAADAVLDAGLTRLTDPMGGDEDPTLGADNAPVTGITDAGDDQHTIAPLKDDATLVVRSPDAALKVVVTDAKTGRSASDAARPGEPARLELDADGDWDVEVRGASGNRYTATVS